MKRTYMKPRVELVSIVFLVLSFSFLALLPSCSGRRSADKLESARWILTAYAVDGSMQDALPTPAVDATFADGKVSGSGGVNQYSGSYEVDGSNLKISALASTQMAGEPAAMEQESAYFANLEAANAYKVDGDTLTIRNVSAETILEFSAADE